MTRRAFGDEACFWSAPGDLGVEERCVRVRGRVEQERPEGRAREAGQGSGRESVVRMGMRAGEKMPGKAREREARQCGVRWGFEVVERAHGRCPSQTRGCSEQGGKVGLCGVLRGRVEPVEVLRKDGEGHAEGGARGGGQAAHEGLRRFQYQRRIPAEVGLVWPRCQLLSLDASSPDAPDRIRV